MTAVLEAIGMEKRFPVKQQMLLRRRDTFQALQGINLALYSGQTLGVVGESGSGKSTLLKAIAGLLGQEGHITGGRIEFDGRISAHWEKRSTGAFAAMCNIFSKIPKNP